MPELPEVETVKLALVPALQGRAVLSAFCWPQGFALAIT